MFLPTAIAQDLAAQSVAARRGRATHRLRVSLPNPISAVRANRRARLQPCPTC